jgi:hypothetical protein
MVSADIVGNVSMEDIGENEGSRAIAWCFVSNCAALCKAVIVTTVDGDSPMMTVSTWEGRVLAMNGQQCFQVPWGGRARGRRWVWLCSSLVSGQRLHGVSLKR